MSDQTPATRPAGITRWLGLNRNPLRPRTDLLQTCILAGLLAAFVAASPLAAAAAGNWLHAAGTREQRAQRSWHQVPAVLLQSAPLQTAFRHWLPPAQVRARWTPPGGQARSGIVSVPPGAPTGSLVRVWADHAGPVPGPSLTGDQITARVSAAATLAVAGLAVVIVGLARAARWLLDRRRRAAWDAAWASAEPRWTRRQ